MPTLKQLFDEYKQELKENPILLHIFVGKDGDSAWQKKSRMLSIAGFRKFIRNTYPNVKFKVLLEDLEAYEAIQDEILSENIEGAAAGIYTASIVQRMHGLVEQVEQTNNNKIIEVKFDMGNDNKLQATVTDELPKGNS